MKKVLLLSTVVCMVSTVSFGMEVKPYIEGKINKNLMRTSYSESGYDKLNFEDSVLGGNLAFGVEVNNNYRLELEGFYNDKLEDSYTLLGADFPVEFKTKGLFLNGYYDLNLPTTTKLKPYIGAGIGYSWMNEKMKLSQYGFSDEKGKDESVSYNIGLGLGYELNQNIDLTLGYRYEYLGKMKVEGSETKVKNNKLSLGLRYTF